MRMTLIVVLVVAFAVPTISFLLSEASSFVLAPSLRCMGHIRRRLPHSSSLLPLPLRNTNDNSYLQTPRIYMTRLFQSSFYGDFENFESDDDDDDDEDESEEEEDDDDDDYNDLNDVDVANFRTRMSSIFDNSGENDDETSAVDELISFATASSSITTTSTSPQEWATSAPQIAPGTVLLANPAKFCSQFAGVTNKVNPSLLAKFGLTLPPPADLGPDRRADLLPVLIVVEYDPKKTCRTVLLNRRTGYLLGDLEQPSSSTGGSSAASSSSSEQNASAPQPLLEKFCIQPLWFGGVDNVSTGLEMLHLCPAVTGATLLTDDGLYLGGDPAQAQEAMSDPSLDRIMTGFDFKFFVQCTSFVPGQLEKEIQSGTFFTANVAKEVLFKSRDRMGTRRAKPLWTEVMELLDGEYLSIKKQLYEEGESS